MFRESGSRTMGVARDLVHSLVHAQTTTTGIKQDLILVGLFLVFGLRCKKSGGCSVGNNRASKH